ncbi:MAG TPA: RNA methyltransferase [Burkholderiales bacterium]|nr:RNA methyltransferase [Burkholderiales bacterium]
MVVEGVHLIAAALAARIKPIALLGTEAALAKPEIAALVRQSELTPEVLTPAVFAAIADTETASGIAAEIPLPEMKRKGAAVFLEGVQDPGNVGAIIRSAAAFGAGLVVLDRQCADPWSPKVLRAGMGGHFALGIRQADDLAAAIAENGAKLICTVVHGGRPLREVGLSGALAWAFGAEGAGLSPGLLELAAERVTIPMAGGESLNVAAAAAICLYETFNTSAAGS